MAYFNIPNVSVKGLSACVPAHVENIADFPLFSEAERNRMLPFFGLSQHRVASDAICPSDLCYSAAVKLLDELGWDRDSIDCLVFTSPLPDHVFPTTACILHNKLGLNRDCAAFDIPFGCSGWVYGMTIVGNMLSSGTIKRALLLVGDTPLRVASREDKSVFPFFGDAGTATALEFEQGAVGLRGQLGTIEEGYDKIILPDGGYRNPVTPQSFEKIESQPGVVRSRLNTHMEGMDVFSLSTKQDPVSIETLLSNAHIEMDTIDCFAFHQTNLFLNERVRKKMKLDPTKVPYSLKEFGNTSGASIPLTLVAERREQLTSAHMNIVACALGVGLSFGACYFETDSIIVPELIEI